MARAIAAAVLVLGSGWLVGPASAQDMPADYAAVLKALGKAGDFRGNVLKVTIPRTDLTVAIDGVVAPLAAGLAVDRVAKIIGTPGEQSGPVYKITIGRPDLDVREHGARIDARMGLNTWAAFAGSDADAIVAGDVAMTAAEVTPVLKAMRASGLQIVAIHHHMLTAQPVYFLHYWGRGPAEKLAGGVRAALDQLARVRR